MHPEADKLVFAAVLERSHHLNAVDNTSDVAQIEQIVRLGGRWAQVFLSKTEHIDGCFDDHLESSCSVLSSNAFFPHMCLNNFDEDALQDDLIEGVARYDVEVASKARCYWVLSSSRWAHGSYEDDVSDLDKLIARVIEVVPLLMVHPLTQDLDRRLCTLRFNSWHVHVIDKDD